MEFVGKVTEIQQMPSDRDDWFVLLARPLREPLFVPSGTPFSFLLRLLLIFLILLLALGAYRDLSMCLFLVPPEERTQVYKKEQISCSAVTEAVRVESRREMVTEENLKQRDVKPPKPLRERDDDWFLLLDVVPKDVSFVAPGTSTIHLPPCSVLVYVIIIGNRFFLKCEFFCSSVFTVGT